MLINKPEDIIGARVKGAKDLSGVTINFDRTVFFPDENGDDDYSPGVEFKEFKIEDDWKYIKTRFGYVPR